MSYNEADTRAKLVDPQLKSSNWDWKKEILENLRKVKI